MISEYKTVFVQSLQVLQLGSSKALHSDARIWEHIENSEMLNSLSAYYYDY